MHLGYFEIRPRRGGGPATAAIDLRIAPFGRQKIRRTRWIFRHPLRAHPVHSKRLLRSIAAAARLAGKFMATEEEASERAHA